MSMGGVMGAGGVDNSPIDNLHLLTHIYCNLNIRYGHIRADSDDSE